MIRRSMLSVFASLIILLLASCVTVWAALHAENMSARDLLRIYILMVTILTIISAGAFMLPYLSFRRQKREIQDLVESVKNKKPYVSVTNSILAESVNELIRDWNEMSNHTVEHSHSSERGERLAALGQFASGLAHEIRTPLTTVLGVAQLALENCNDQGVKEDLEKIVAAARRCERVTESVLNFARVEVIEKSPVSLKSVIVLMSSEAMHIEIETAINENADRLMGDETLLRRVIENMVRNAKNAGAKIVRISSERSGSEIVIKVTNDGPGIPTDIIGNLFEPFATKSKGGLGLGLALAKSIISAHEGTIQARNLPEGGPEFEIRIPVK